MLENLNTRVSIILFVIAVSWYFLIPTIKLYNNSNLSTEEIQQLEKDAINLGLDLKGGLRIVLELDDAVYFKNELTVGLRKASKIEAENFIEKSVSYAKTEKIDIFKAMSKIATQDQIKLNKYYADISKSTDNDVVLQFLQESRSLTMKSIEDKMRKRISQHDQYGLGEPTIQRVGKNRLNVELAGVSNSLNAKAYIQRTAEFEISLVKQLNFKSFVRGMENISQYFKDNEITFVQFLIQEEISSKIELEALSQEEISIINKQRESQNQNIQKSPLENKENFHELLSMENYLKDLTFEDFFSSHLDWEHLELYGGIVMNTECIEILSQFLNHKDIKNRFSTSSKFLFSQKIVSQNNSKTYKQLYEVNSKPAIKNNMIDNPKAVTGEIGTKDAGKWVINLGMKEAGENAWYKFTEANVGEQAAIILDKEVYFAPYINEAIKGGHTQISGFDNMQEAKDIASVLKAGELDAPMHIIHDTTVHPSLGQESINAGAKAMFIGLCLVFIFIIIYYKGAGIVASLALLMNLFFVLAVLVTLDAVLTLPGIAGLLLTVGMTVDANVIIFERIKEELSSGLNPSKALHRGYDKAFLTILDANITTLLTAFVLSFIGSGPIKGFATTLSVGIICSMFTAVFITKTIFLFFPRITKRLSA